MEKSKKIENKKRIENGKGITLIALVITIIVLLILAGVSIAMLTGDNGILTQAQNAREKTDKATEEEKIQMAVLGSSLDNNGYVDILDETSFKQELANQFGNQSLDVVANGDGSFIITVEDTQRKYYINDDKTVINSDNIIEISTEQQLKDFRDDVNAGNSYEGKAVLLTSDITLSGNWTPIGTYSEETPDDHYLDVEVNKPFKGIFDGCNHTISNLQINSTEDYQGLFGLVIDGTIRDITIASEGSSVKAGGVSGVIVGTLYGFSGNIYNCVNNANGEFSATGGGIVGGLIGQHTVSNCKNYGSITTQGSAGGIVGGSNGVDWEEEFYNYSHKIINCGNYGTVSNSGNNCGGIAGYLKGQILNCCNKGEIFGGNDGIGGIVGNISNGRILKNCYNIAKVSGQLNVSGIIGNITGEIVTDASNCYSVGEINGTNDVGDIMGKEDTGIIKSQRINCYTKDDTFTAEDLGDAFKDNPENANQPLLYWE